MPTRPRVDAFTGGGFQVDIEMEKKTRISLGVQRGEQVERKMSNSQQLQKRRTKSVLSTACRAINFVTTGYGGGHLAPRQQQQRRDIVERASLISPPNRGKRGRKQNGSDENYRIIIRQHLYGRKYLLYVRSTAFRSPSRRGGGRVVNYTVIAAAHILLLPDSSTCYASKFAVYPGHVYKPL